MNRGFVLFYIKIAKDIIFGWYFTSSVDPVDRDCLKIKNLVNKSPCSVLFFISNPNIFAITGLIFYLFATSRNHKKNIQVTLTVPLPSTRESAYYLAP